jgi:hypothetical protein
LKRDKQAQVRQIHENAVHYYETFDDDLSRTEELYHRLSLGVDRPKLEQRWREDLRPRLSGVIHEFPPKTQAYVAARLGVEIKEEYWAKADLEDWELYAARRARDLLDTDQPVQALQATWQRARRTDASPLFDVELEALIEAVKEMQRFFSIHLNVKVSRRAAEGLYRAILWCIENNEVSHGSESYIRSNFGAGPTHEPLAALISSRIVKPLHRTSADGGEVEFGLRSMLEILRHTEVKGSRQEMLKSMMDELRELVKEFEKRALSESRPEAW